MNELIVREYFILNGTNNLCHTHFSSFFEPLEISRKDISFLLLQIFARMVARWILSQSEDGRLLQKIFEILYEKRVDDFFQMVSKLNHFSLK